MKLSNKTTSILKSLSGINIGMVIPKGKMIQVESTPRDIFARCDIEEEFPQEIGIYDMPNFISTLSMFDDPELDIQPSHLNIKSGRNQCDYHYVTNTDYIVHGDWLDIKDDAYKLSFDLSEDDITNIQKASSIMSLDQLVISNEDGKVVCNVASTSNDTKNTYSIDLGECDKSLDFELVMRIAENFRFYTGDYKVKIAKIGDTIVFHSTNTAINLQYQIAMDRESYFN